MKKPQNCPDIVYKYRNWKCQYHKDILCKNHLYLSPPKDFNDPFDCRIPINYYLLDTPEKKDKYIDTQTENYCEEGKIIQRKELEERLKNLDKFQEDYEKQIYDFQDKYLGVLCLSRRWDSILMWSHYADNHKGYCVGIYEEKLRNYCSRERHVPIDIVETTDDYPQIDPLDSSWLQARKQISTKAKDWKYEEEYRITQIFDFFKPNIAPPTKQERTITIDDDFFAEIIIGLETPPDDKNEIIKIGKQKGIKVYEAIKVPFKFQINKKEIV